MQRTPGTPRRTAAADEPTRTPVAVLWRLSVVVTRKTVPSSVSDKYTLVLP